MRICTACGKLMVDGMTDLCDFYTHEGDCFTKEMDATYGKGNWHETYDEGECGGFYEADGIDTGIFYTDWYGDGCELEEVTEYIQDVITELDDAFCALAGDNDGKELYLAIIQGVKNAMHLA